MSDIKQEDARTAPVGVWQVLESLRGEELSPNGEWLNWIMSPP